MDPLLLALILVAAGVLLIGAELILPGGVLGAVGALLAVGGVVACFFHSPAAGAAGLAGLIVLVPVGWSLYVRNIGRIFGAKGTVLPPAETAPAVADAPVVPGQTGVAVSELRPGGVADFGDARVQVTSESGMIRAGAAVRVVRVADGRATVRAV